ncbi:hypothetical protein [Sutcliffiella horikoshii]|nr:hypothetical protein [Sutcliffiella horikoshii]
MKDISKIYKKLISTDDEYKKFIIVDKLDPHTAKRVLMSFVLNKK